MAQADGNRLKQIALAHATRFSTAVGLGFEGRASEAALTIVIDRLGKAVYLGHGNRGWEERPGVTESPGEFDRSKALMNVTILVCACGKRVRAPGARPGRVGRCPACGRSLKAPAATGAPARPETGAKVAAGTHVEELATGTQDSTGAGGYLLEPAERPPAGQARKQRRVSSSPPVRAPAGGEEFASRTVRPITNG